LAPVFGAAVVGLFLFWAWTYRQTIVSTFKSLGIPGLMLLMGLSMVALVLTVAALVTLVRDKGYVFRFSDGYHSLNVSQLASMIPGGIWGYAGFAGVLWSKGISKADSVVIVFFHSVLMLSSCAIVGFSGLAAVLGWSYAAVILLPALFLLVGRNWIDRLRQRLFPETSPLPSTAAAIKVLALGILVWAITAGAFAWLLYRSEGFGAAPFWTITGAYAAGYLGGYVAVFAPSGLGVSEGLVALMLGPYVGAGTVLGIAISFRIVQTLVTWFNIAVTLVLISKGREQRRPRGRLQ
jgi:hypothetical protein